MSAENGTNSLDSGGGGDQMAQPRRPGRMTNQLQYLQENSPEESLEAQFCMAIPPARRRTAAKFTRKSSEIKAAQLP